MVKTSQGSLAKITILLFISLGIFWIAEDFRFGIYFDDESFWYKFFAGYFKDLVLPFAFYFLLCSLEQWIPSFRLWQIKALMAFLIPTLMEVGQGLYYPLFDNHLFLGYIGSFDLVDIVMYAISVMLAVFVERKIFINVFKF